MDDEQAGRIDQRPIALHVITRYQRGGSERRVRDIIRATPELRHHLLVGADSDVELAAEQTGAEQVSVLPALIRRVSPVDDVRALIGLWRLLRRDVYSVVVTHQSKAGVLARAAAAAGGPAAVHSLSMASFGPGYGQLENAVFRRLERLLGSRTAAYAVVGADLADRFAAVGVPRDRLHVVRSGVPLPHLLPDRAAARDLLHTRYGTVPGRPLICYVGSLEPRKNPVLLAQLLRDLHDRMSAPPDLLVIGDGPQRDELLAELARLCLSDRAVLTGYLSEPRLVHEALRAVDVVLLLSDAEGLPQVLVQAAAAGTPYVAFDVEGVRELLALGAQGTPVPHGRLDLAADAVEHWLSDSLERDVVADVSSWSPDAIAASYRSVLTGVLAASRRSARR
ncbi:glycosyltransferase [Blastococcus sp. LR1]|uniref:glycosyltransferase n=1 Tax=Blastococcus sp. LR1 TaxID=2877000 RepID=UPI001CC99CF4|nr:glycosyltransferase [Blastococcus sp. LR1]MCA0144867.1 glycosyltransferase [Blastococcus sp. LR1]